MNFISFHDNRSLPPPAQHRCVFLWHAAFPAVQRIDGESHSRMDRNRILDPMLPGKCPHPPGKAVHFLFGICSGVKASLLTAVTRSRFYWWLRRSFFDQSDEVTLAFMQVTDSTVTFGGYCSFLMASMMVLESWLFWSGFHVQGISLPLYRRAE